MKKLFVLLLALMVAGVFAFAQDAAPALKWSGYLNTGLAYSKTGSDDDSVVQNGDDSATAGRLNLNASYNAGDYGVNFRVRSQPSGGFVNSTGGMSGSGGLFLRRVYGWTNFAGGMVKVQAGRLADYTWTGANGAYWNCFGNFDGPVGVQIQVKPMDGLNAGIFVPISNGVAKTLSDTLQSSALGLNYTQKGVFNVQAGYQMGVDTDEVAATKAKMVYTGTPTTTTTTVGTVTTTTTTYDTGTFTPSTAKVLATKSNSSIWFGGQVLAVPNLTADFEGRLTSNKEGTAKKGSTFIFEAVYYQMDAIKVGAQMSQEMFADSGVKSQIYLSPEASYALDAATTLGVTSNIALKDGKNGLGVGVYGKLVTAKNSFIKVAAGVETGDWQAKAGNVVFKAPGVWAARSDNTTWALVDFVWNF